MKRKGLYDDDNDTDGDGAATSSKFKRQRHVEIWPLSRVDPTTTKYIAVCMLKERMLQLSPLEFFFFFFVGAIPWCSPSMGFMGVILEGL